MLIQHLTYCHNFDRLNSPTTNMPEIDILVRPLEPEALGSLIDSAPLPGLDDQPHCKETQASVERLVKSSEFRGTLLESALWLLAGELDRSHTISQAFESSEGSFWHGIMHRREGDYGNAKYWFRRTGTHPVHEELANRIGAERDRFSSDLPLGQLVSANEFAETLVDVAESACRGNESWRRDAELICWWEWQLLFNFCDSRR